MKPFYVTTPIYYVNDRPHIGHAYSTVAADCLARYQRLRGRPVRFLTGTDEHGQKVERAAQQHEQAPQAFVDSMVAPFREVLEDVVCTPDDFIRTTDRRHKEAARRMWQRLNDAGDIYLGEYEGWYSVSSEAFYTEKDLLPGHLDPITKKPVEKVREKSYFFRLGNYTDKLLAFYEANPKFVRPEGRFNEVKAFVREGLRDLSISRTTFRWGVPVPGDRQHVMYVWLDALTNYISALGGPPGTEGGLGDGDTEAPLFERFWAPSADVIHVVGKDILRFHAVYWPAFLMSAGIEPPMQVWAHGWLTVDGEKMSKSSGNFLPPRPLVDAVGADALRYYFLRDVAFGQDGDFSHHSLFARYHGELGNGLGNLLNRVVASVVKKNFDGRVPMVDLDALAPEDRELIATAQRVAKEAAAHLDDVAPNRALDAVWELVGAANRYIDQTAPWKLAKEEGQRERLAQVCYTAMEALRWLSVMLWPVMPDKCDGLRAQLGLPPLMPTEELDRWPSAWGGLQAHSATRPDKPLFPRFEPDQQEALLQSLGAPATGTTDKQSNARKAGQKASPVSSKSEQAESKTTAKLGSGTQQAKEPGVTEPTEAKPAATTQRLGSEAPFANVIDFQDFLKIDLRLGTVRSAERVPKSNKLLRLSVDIGEAAPRQILAGIGKSYEPAELEGRQLVIVANLPPRQIMGLESQGMVLAVSDEEGLSVLGTDKPVQSGRRVS